jgi:hypothetical protein
MTELADLVHNPFVRLLLLAFVGFSTLATSPSRKLEGHGAAPLRGSLKVHRRQQLPRRGYPGDQRVLDHSSCCEPGAE